MNTNPIILNFKDTLLHQSDIDLLMGPHWLNDNIITFYFEYLEKAAYLDEKDLLFISPEVVQCLKATKGTELTIFLDPLAAKQKKFVFLALNNCEIMDKAGGSHWSLLVYSKPEETFYHFDSLKGTNYSQAGKLSGKLLRYLSSDGTGDFIEYECLQQTNSYDCGIYLLCNVDFIINYCLKDNKVNGCGIISEQCAKKKRSDILRIIKNLQSKGY
ncbi:Sentrin-specific protease, putative [Pediculus humanus corporis]|uniref:Sentrin-specific protease, putative n=1 Tax=Pediculus humanus subsp. corporis TaxID=121224 RepID=E0VQE1_PEDHC|nr:Sentrin-specific protease, putative [Pediculus humanus corporis]EEB15597.1 Sentrin-specific protease, putative [Pediculus humanus corporis]